MNLKKSSKACIVAMVFTVTAVHPSWGVPVLQNSGFETASTNNPGGAANWYGYTFSSDGGVGTAVAASNLENPDAVATGSVGFLLNANSTSGGYSAAWVESERYALPGGSLELAFQFRNLPSSAGSVWSEYKIHFFDSIVATNPLSTITRTTGYSWVGWTKKTDTNIVVPSGANFISVSFHAYGSDSAGIGGDSQWAFDNVFLSSRLGVTRTVLLDIGGRSNADGGWYAGRTPASPDTNGNYWNILDPGIYAGNMRTQADTATTIGAGFIATNHPVMAWFNGPAGNDTEPWSINHAALGDLGNKEAAFDYVFGTNIRMSIDGLTVGKKYRLNFYCSRRWEGDPATTISVFGDNTFDSSVKLAEDTVNNRSATQGWVFNADTLLTLDELTPTGTSLFLNIVGASGGHGALNAMSIQELDAPSAADTTPPVITILGNNPETVVWGSSYSDAGATAEDAGAPVNVVPDASAVNTAILGSYAVSYVATDAANNLASTNRMVNVVLPSQANVADADGLSPLLRYALGASGPSGTVAKPTLSTDANELVLTALIRTSGITVVGQSATNVSVDGASFSDLGTNPNGVASADQTNLSPGTERREFRTPKDTPQKFLRLKVTQP